MSLRSVGSMLKPPGDAVEVLAVSPLNIDCIRLRQILSGRNWRLQEVSSCGEASALLDERDFPVVLCERSQTDGNWKDLLDVTATLPTPPSLVVCSRLADESLWAEVLNLGGFDVVLMPFEPDEVLRVTFAAWRKWSEVSLNRPPDKRRIERASEPARKSCQAKWPEAGLPRALNPLWYSRRRRVDEMVEPSPAMGRDNMASREKRTPGPSGFDETAVVNRARNGDFRAFTELVERHEASVFRLMRHFTRSQGEAEEALQEAFLEAWEDLGELQGQSEFRPWLIRIAVRQARKRLRERQRGRAVRLDEPGGIVGETVAQELPDRALESLHPDLRAVFVLRDMEGIRAEDTAAMLQLTVQAVRGRLLRARMQVQERLSPYFKRNPFEAQAGQTQFCPRVLS